MTHPTSQRCCKNYAPWYVMMWRSIWIVPCYAALGLLCGLYAVCYGPSKTKRLWRDVT